MAEAQAHEPQHAAKTIDPTLKTRWLAALRSGEYTQGRFRLRNAYNAYCCLGVLCDIEGIALSNMADSYGDIESAYQWVYRTIGRELTDKLTPMNDGGATFPEIANYIEAHA